MAELSTIARPYANGLWKALEGQVSAQEAQGVEDALDALAVVVNDPKVSQLVGDPNLTNEEIFEQLKGALGKGVPSVLAGLLRVVIENDRLAALPEIAVQFRALKNESEGVADAYIETAFALKDNEVKEILASLSKKFSGKKLNPIVSVNPALIGGVSVRVGDKILDSSVRSRLMQMQAALTA